MYSTYWRLKSFVLINLMTIFGNGSTFHIIMFKFCCQRIHMPLNIFFLKQEVVTLHIVINVIISIFTLLLYDFIF